MRACRECGEKWCECLHPDPLRQTWTSQSRNGVPLVETSDVYWLLRSMRFAGWVQHQLKAPEREPRAPGDICLAEPRYMDRRIRFDGQRATKTFRRTLSRAIFKTRLPVSRIVAQMRVSHGWIIDILTGELVPGEALERAAAWLATIADPDTPPSGPVQLDWRLALH